VARNAATWQLNSFLDSLILELDRAQDTLAVKGLNRRLTYAVRDLSLELQLFPEFDGRQLRFSTARPGESGAAKIAFQLGSITDRQIRETTKDPITKDDVAIETVEGIDDEVKTELQKVGVTSVKDIERMQRNNIDIERVSGAKVDYGRLANVINRAKRRSTPPTVFSASLAMSDQMPTLVIEGENLVLAGPPGDFPLAYLNGEPVRVVAASPRELRLAVPEDRVRGDSNELRVLLDPHAIMTVSLQS
jgi:hypothetical protein